MYLIYIMYVCNDVPTITTILFKIKHLFELKVQKKKGNEYRYDCGFDKHIVLL